MEIGISDRNASLCDGAKDEGKTAIDDCKIPIKGRYVVSQDIEEMMVDSDSEYESERESDCDNNRKFVKKLHLDCSDRVRIDADPFKSHSGVVLMRYVKGDFGIIEVESNSTTLEMVKEFCEGRLKIVQDYAAAKKSLQISKEIAEPLNEFNSKFLQDYRSYAFQLITAAFDLEIRQLIFLMMEEVVKLFTKMTEDEVYRFFFVNLKEYREDKFNDMKEDLLKYKNFFVSGGTPNNYWDPDILKQKFHSLETYEKRGQWLTAHFFLRRPHLAKFYRAYLKGSAADEEEEKR